MMLLWRRSTTEESTGISELLMDLSHLALSSSFVIHTTFFSQAGLWNVHRQIKRSSDFHLLFKLLSALNEWEFFYKSDPKPPAWHFLMNTFPNESSSSVIKPEVPNSLAAEEHQSTACCPRPATTTITTPAPGMQWGQQKSLCLCLQAFPIAGIVTQALAPAGSVTVLDSHSVTPIAVWLFHCMLQCSSGRHRVPGGCGAFESSQDQPPPNSIPSPWRNCLPWGQPLVLRTALAELNHKISFLWTAEF